MHLTKPDSAEGWEASAVVAVVGDWAAATESAPAKTRVRKKRMVAGMATAGVASWCHGGRATRILGIYEQVYKTRISFPRIWLTASERPGEREKEGISVGKRVKRKESTTRAAKGQVGGHNEQRASKTGREE